MSGAATMQCLGFTDARATARCATFAHFVVHIHALSAWLVKTKKSGPRSDCSGARIPMDEAADAQPWNLPFPRARAAALIWEPRRRPRTTARCIQATVPEKADHPGYALLHPRAVNRTITSVACFALHLAQAKSLEAGMMNTRRFATVALCRSVFFAGCVVAWPATVGLAEIGSAGAAPLTDHQAPRLAGDAESAAALQVIATDNLTVGADDAAAATPAPVSPTTTATATGSDKPHAPEQSEAAVETASTRSPDMVPADTPPAQVTTASRQDREPDETTGSVSAIDIVDECFVMEICVDRYLWKLYRRTPKEDSIKLQERRNVTVRKKHRTVTVTRTFTKLADEDFAWKDPKAAEKAGLSMMDYVIGGMDLSFKLKLFYTLHAAEAAGLAPGITSAFRDDYRQSIASGLKAATDRSYHGGSFRGGYGHGLAADIVSVNGATRAERWVATESLWKWIDAHGREFGIGRPYLGRDPPHVAPIDGQEYAAHNGGETTHAASDLKKRKHLATRDDHSVAKSSNSARSAKPGTIRSARDTPSRTLQAKLHS
jgi:hypothetical protein